jgi:hypothetical protein
MPSGINCLPFCQRGKEYVRTHVPECEPSCKKLVKGWGYGGRKSRRVRRHNRRTRRR